MNRCMELAKNGLGTTYPNPMVGSVIVYNDTIIGEGWHQKSGEPHAEVNAINAVKDKSLLKKATIYVSLEPCSHFGKTPPCCDLIIAQGIPNVVIGTTDPNEKVAGKGIQKLVGAGKNVTVGILEKECRELNRRFFTFHLQQRPYIILKWAETADGFIAPKSKNDQKPVWITNTYSRQLVHKWRSEEHAILVGTQTVLDDNPKLDVRDWSGNNPIRIVIDRNLRIPKDAQLFHTTSKTIVVTGKDFDADENVVAESIDFDKNIARQIADVLYRHGIQSVIIEGGRQTLQTFIDVNLWDEARVFKGKTVFGDGTKAPQIDTVSFASLSIIDDELSFFKNESHD